LLPQHTRELTNAINKGSSAVSSNKVTEENMFEALVAVTKPTKIIVFWDMTLCSLVEITNVSEDTAASSYADVVGLYCTAAVLSHSFLEK
jgi:hypothetical protein